jgi:predicted TIM-barrel fold metal-dependent hydrolase
VMIDIDTHFGAHPAMEQVATIPVLLQALQCDHFDRALVYSRTAILFDAAVGNAETLAACREHPNLSPVAVLDPRVWGAWESVSSLVNSGIVAFRFFPYDTNWSLENGSFRRIVDAIAKTGRPIMIDGGVAGQAVAAVRAMRNLPIDLILMNLYYSTIAEAMAEAVDSPRVYLEATRITMPGEVELLVEVVGAEKLLFGSHAPTHEGIPTIRMVQTAEIPAEAKDLILGGNAARLFHLPVKG